MERKTAKDKYEAAYKEGFDAGVKHNTNLEQYESQLKEKQKLLDELIEKYRNADQEKEAEAVGFAGWITDNGFVNVKACYTDERGNVISPADLYKIFKSFKQNRR